MFSLGTKWADFSHGVIPACAVLYLAFFFALSLPPPQSPPSLRPIISVSIVLFHILLDFVGLALLIVY